MTGLPRSSTGFSLVELLVAMVLGFLLSMIAGGIFLSARESHNTQDDIARLQENIRSATTLLDRVGRLAGYRSNPGQSFEQVFPVSAPAIFGEDGLGLASDRLTVRFQGDYRPRASSTDPILDGMAGSCEGLNSPWGTTTTNVFTIAVSDNTPWLACGRDDPTVPPELLVPGVEAMQVLYGVDDTLEQRAETQRFVAAQKVTDWRRVTAIRVYLLFRTERPTATRSEFNVFPLGEQEYGPFDDHFVRRRVVLTIALRNREILS